MDDPFKPPKANLEVPVELGPRPRAVRTSFALLCASVTITGLLAVATALGFVTIPAGSSLIATVVSNLAGAGIIFFFAWKIRAGRNWARWVLAVFQVLGMIGFAISIMFIPDAWKVLPRFLLVLSIAQTFLQLAAAILAFTPPANEWFRAARSAG